MLAVHPANPIASAIVTARFMCRSLLGPRAMAGVVPATRAGQIEVDRGERAAGSRAARGHAHVRARPPTAIEHA
jgi:hypothetical protein